MPYDKVIDSYSRSPNYLAANRRLSDPKQRSTDSTQFLASPGDITPGDPVFILRRVIVPRTSSSHHLPPTPLDRVVLQLLRESIPSSDCASEDDSTNTPPHEASFEQHGCSMATQLELTMQSLSEFLSPSVTLTPTVEFNETIKQSLRRAQDVVNEYLHMVRNRDDWWRARLAQEQRRRAVLQQSLQSFVQERGMIERGLRRYLGRPTGIDSNISDRKGPATINPQPPTPPLEDLGLKIQEHIQDTRTTIQIPSIRERLFVTDSTVVSQSLGNAPTPSSFTTHSVMSPTSTSFMDADSVNHDGSRLLKTVSTSPTGTQVS